jgi:hypothetical protein
VPAIVLILTLTAAGVSRPELPKSTQTFPNLGALMTLACSPTVSKIERIFFLTLAPSPTTPTTQNPPTVCFKVTQVAPTKEIHNPDPDLSGSYQFPQSTYRCPQST